MAKPRKSDSTFGEHSGCLSSLKTESMHHCIQNPVACKHETEISQDASRRAWEKLVDRYGMPCREQMSRTKGLTCKGERRGGWSRQVSTAEHISAPKPQGLAQVVPGELGEQMMFDLVPGPHRIVTVFWAALCTAHIRSRKNMLTVRTLGRQCYGGASCT